VRDSFKIGAKTDRRRFARARHTVARDFYGTKSDTEDPAAFL